MSHTHTHISICIKACTYTFIYKTSIFTQIYAFVIYVIFFNGNYFCYHNLWVHLKKIYGYQNLSADLSSDLALICSMVKKLVCDIQYLQNQASNIPSSPRRHILQLLWTMYSQWISLPWMSIETQVHTLNLKWNS